ncbi:hypothetical protein MASR1M45_28280 [Candidatus Kapaibacterium sp.]
MWKEVFKAGKHTDANGNEREWSSEDIDAIISKYNNQMPDDKHEAPVVIGHPVNNSPAYAWVESLKKDGETLLAKFTQIDPEFEQLIKEGRYKKVSIALYPDMMLRHIGFLGAIPPAVKGLKDSEFNGSESFICFGELKGNTSTTETEQNAKNAGTNNQQNLNTNEQMFNTCSTDVEQSGNKIQQIKLKEIKEKNIYSSPSKFSNFEGQEKPFSPNQKSINFQGGNMPDKYSKLFQELLGWLGSTFNEEIANQTAEELERIKSKYLNGSESKTESKTEASEPDVKQSKEFQEMQRKLELLEKDNRDMKFNDYFKSQLGRLVPAQKPIVKLAFEAMKDNKGFEFSENGSQVKMSGEDLLKRLIESFPVQIEFNEITKQNAYSDSNDLEGQNKFIDEYYQGR